VSETIHDAATRFGALSHSEKDALITALLARIDALVARVAALEAETAEPAEARHSDWTAPPDLAAAAFATYHARLQTSLDVLLKIVAATEPGHKLQRIIKRFRPRLFSSPIATSRPPTTAPSRPCVASDPDGAQTSTPTSDPSSNPRDDGGSASSTQTHAQWQPVANCWYVGNYIAQAPSLGL
jgi:hypothetical protein